MKFMIALLWTLSALATTYTSEGQKFSIEELFSRKDVIWGFDFAPDGRIVFTERSGKMFLFEPSSKKIIELTGIPKVYAVGQGGLLDVRLHPDFKKTHRIFFTFSEPVGEDKSTTALGTAILTGDKLSEVRKIFSAVFPTDEDYHYGSRIEFDDKGKILMTIGERGQRLKSLDKSFHVGKMVRLNEDGTAADGNPFLKDKTAKPEIYTIGHRSPQGLTKNPATGEIWEAEMGPLGGDELNLIKAGANYGWSEVTKGREYYGASIGVKEKKGVEEPVAFWVPSISPSGIAFYSGDKFPAWKGNIFLGTLSGEHLHRVVLQGTKVVKQEKLLEDLKYRFRCVRQGPEGFLYFSTDEGKLGRLVPTK